MAVWNVVFDLGGVLVDWNPKVWLAELFGDGHADLLESFVTKNPGWVALDLGETSVEEIAQSFVRCGCSTAGCTPESCSMPDRDLADRFLAFISECATFQYRVIPSGQQVLREVRAHGHHAHILSNFHRDMAACVRARHHAELFALIDGVQVISADVHSVKPEVDIYEILLQRLMEGSFAVVRRDRLDADGFVPHVVFLDDKWVNVMAARQCGIRSILVEDWAAARRELCELGIL